MTPAALTCDVSRYTITNIQLPFDRSVIRSTALIQTSFGIIASERCNVSIVRVGNRSPRLTAGDSTPHVSHRTTCPSFVRNGCFSDIGEFAAWVIGSLPSERRDLCKSGQISDFPDLLSCKQVKLPRRCHFPNRMHFRKIGEYARVRPNVVPGMT